MNYRNGKAMVKHHKRLYTQDEAERKNGVSKYGVKPTFVPLLWNELNSRQRQHIDQKNFNVAYYPFATSPNLTISNLSKVGARPQYDFIMTDEQLKEMIETPKVVIRETGYMIEDKYTGEPFCVKSLYLIAPFLKDETLPCIYRMSVRVSQDESFFAVSMQAVVGGCADGSVNLERVDSPHIIYGEMEDIKIEQPHIHKAVAGRSSKRVESLPKQMLDANKCETVEDALKILMEDCGVMYYFDGADMKLFDLIAKLRKDVIHKIAPPISQEIINQILNTNCPTVTDLHEFVRKDSERGYKQVIYED